MRIFECVSCAAARTSCANVARGAFKFILKHNFFFITFPQLLVVAKTKTKLSGPLLTPHPPPSLPSKNWNHKLNSRADDSRGGVVKLRQAGAAEPRPLKWIMAAAGEEDFCPPHSPTTTSPPLPRLLSLATTSPPPTYCWAKGGRMK